MALPTARMTRGEIIQRAAQRAANTQQSVLSQARDRLNRVLQDLYIQYDWPFLFVEVGVTLPPVGSFTLPADFTKTQDEWGLRVTQWDGNAVNVPLVQVDPMTFVSRMPWDAGPAHQLPRWWTIDHANGVGKFLPRPDVTTAASLRYKYVPPDMPTTDETAYNADVPVFPWGNYLSDVMLHWFYAYQGSMETQRQFVENKDAFDILRGATFPPNTVLARDLPLDPVIFTRPWSGGTEGDW
jgi:hypothetical protein